MKRKWLIGPVFALCLGGAGWFFLRPEPAPAPVVFTPSPRQVADTEKRLAGVGQTVSGPHSAPAHEPRTLRLSESDLNVVLASSKPLRKLLSSHGIQAVQLVLAEPDKVTLHAAATVQGHTQNIQISGTLVPDPKTGLRYIADSAKIGSLPLPAIVVTSQASNLAARFSHQYLSRLSLSVQSVSVQKKELVIVGVPVKPASPQSASPARH